MRCLVTIFALSISITNLTTSRISAQKTTSNDARFTFVIQGGATITGIPAPASAGKPKRTIVFVPLLERTDGNLYNAALHSLWNVYGKRRGLFQLGDARLIPEPSLGGNAICWRISNPDADYCVFPTKDEASGKIAALDIWVR